MFIREGGVGMPPVWARPANGVDFGGPRHHLHGGIPGRPSLCERTSERRTIRARRDRRTDEDEGRLVGRRLALRRVWTGMFVDAFKRSDYVPQHSAWRFAALKEPDFRTPFCVFVRMDDHRDRRLSGGPPPGLPVWRYSNFGASSSSSILSKAGIQVKGATLDATI